MCDYGSIENGLINSYCIEICTSNTYTLCDNYIGHKVFRCKTRAGLIYKSRSSIYIQLDVFVL